MWVLIENIMKAKYLYFILAVAFCMNTSCKKDWLEKKRDISLIVPITLNDLRLALDGDNIFETDSRGIMEVAADDIYTSPTLFASWSTEMERNAFTWNNDVFGASVDVAEWQDAYKQIVYANIALDGLGKITRNETNKGEYDAIKGRALFFRAKAYMNLVMTFCKYYETSTASSNLGIPLKLTSDISEPIKRTSLEESYKRIIADLSSASDLLPNTVIFNGDPTKPAAFGLLARCYLFMDNYSLALQAANSSYSIQSSLMDFNTLNPAAARPISATNVENHIYAILSRSFTSQSSGSYIDKQLYNSYDANDLRKIVFFGTPINGDVLYKGSFAGTARLFGGTTTGEMLLIRAECKARLNDVPGALTDLNTLLSKRFKTGTFIPFTATSSNETLEKILIERRKELVRRGLRLQDLKRLNRDTKFAKTLTRVLGDKTYALPPNDPRYVFPIPDYIIQYNGIQQNPR